MRRRTWGMTYTALLCRLILDEDKAGTDERPSNPASAKGKPKRQASWSGSSRKSGIR
ncbi:hypothetical protein [Paenibacillus glycinis]|uniref:Uncharacterized protein n=1 Tax=Paenibacillus glycinis TaxID=2697035 RepID=A0ABW9XXG3_9BACL|nr:hypothetical protein [Paenibacillus glycinis]NBD26936.1 hypothetical protein [Paenibacillus glycinis]